jgi:uncharacterized protein YaaN involved in tellurite resistance
MDATTPAPPGPPAPEPGLPALANQMPASDLIDPARFDDPRRRQAVEIASGVSIHDSNSIAVFGAAPQRRLSGFLDQLLAGTKSDDIGVAGELVVELATDIKALNLPAMKREAEGKSLALAGVPIVGKYFSAFRRFRAMQQQVTTHLSQIEQRADTHLAKLKANNAGLDKLLDATEQNLRELEVWVAGGQQALLRMRDEFTAAREALRQERDPVKLTRLRDMGEQINAFETRLVRMQVAFTRGILAIPQIRIAQQAGRIEIQNTLDTVLFDLPDLKAAIVRVAALNQISRASEATQARRRITRELQEIGVDALDRAYTTAKATQGDMGADVANLAHVTERMLGILDRGMRIDEDNRGKREEAMRQLGDVRARLIEGLRASNDKVVQG